MKAERVLPSTLAPQQVLKEALQEDRDAGGDLGLHQERSARRR